MLEECGLPYRILSVNIGGSDQFKREFWLSVQKLHPGNRGSQRLLDEPRKGLRPIIVDLLLSATRRAREDELSPAKSRRESIDNRLIR